MMLLSAIGPLCYLADYVYFNERSIFHVVDRVVAMVGMVLELWRVRLLQQFANPIMAFISTATVTLAIGCFLRSRRAQAAKHLSDFLVWHTLWHI